MKRSFTLFFSFLDFFVRSMRRDRFFLLFWPNSPHNARVDFFQREERALCKANFEHCAVGTRTTIDQPGDCFCSLARSLVVVYVALFFFRSRRG